MTKKTSNRSRQSAIRRGGLRAKIIVWSFVPTAIILLAVASVTVLAFQRVTEQLVLQRDKEVTFVSASQLASKLGEYEDLLTTVGRTADIYGDDPAAQQDALMRAGNRLAAFDGGVLLLDAFGKVVAAQPERPQVVGQDWSSRVYYQDVVRSQITSSAPRLIVSDVVSDGPDGVDVIACAFPIVDDQDQFQGTVVGMFRVGPDVANRFYADILKLRLAESGSTYLVDKNGRVVFHSDAERIGEDFGAQTVVQQVLEGQVDAFRTRDFAGRDIVAGFAPVPGTPWGLVTEETWSTLTRGFQRYQNLLLILLVLGVLVPASVIYIGVSRTTRPITDLMHAAQEVARGHFDQTITAKTGDEIEELARQFSHMSVKLQESYANLEQKVADRTRELATLNTIAAVVSRSLDLDEILNDVLGQILVMLEVEAGAILLLEPGGEFLTTGIQRGFTDAFVQVIRKIGVREGVSGQALIKGEPVVLNIEDYIRAGFAERLSADVLKEGLQTLVSTPLIHKGQTLGVLDLATRRPRAFPPQELDLLTAIGQQIGVAVENARLYEQTQQELVERKRAEEELRRGNEERARRNRELLLLNRVIAASTSRLEPQAVLEAVCRELALAFNVPEVGAALLDQTGTSLTVVAEHISEGRPSALGVVMPAEGYPSAEYVLRHKVPLAVVDAQRDPEMAPVHELMRQRGTASMLILPLIVRGQAVGTIGMVSVERRAFTEEEIALAANAAAAASQALESARAEEALRESEETLKLAMEGADVGLWDQSLGVDAYPVIYDWTERLGYAPGEIPTTYQSWYQLVHPDDKPKFEQAWEKYISGEASLYEMEHRVRAKSGEWAWILLRGKVVVEDENGNPLRISGIHQNITARKQAEEALRESQQKLSLHVQHTPLAYIEWDGDLRVADWNPAAERIFGYRKDEAIGRHAYEIIVPLSAQQHVTAVWQQILDQTGGTRSTNENVTKDGRTIACEWYNTPLIDENGRVIGLASLVHDITDQVTAAENLQEAKESAEEARMAAEAANRAKSTFLANMSHELRTPLNAILGFAQLMTRDPALTPEQQENLSIIGRSGEHLLDLINDVLEMSKIEAGRVQLEKENFDLYRLLDDLDEMFQLRVNDKGLTLTFDRAPDLPQYVRTDEGKLRQVLMNLVGNAVKFTHEGGVTLRVNHVDQPAQGTKRLHFEVEDTGPGIAPEELEAVFSPFVQTESGQAQASQEGTGLGLPISRQFVRLLGGDLTFSSELDRGSLFMFDVQVEPAEPSGIGVARPEKRVVGLAPDQPVFRLLVVEDRETNRKLLVNLLTSLGPPPSGFEVREATNGREAIEIWERWKPHLIWMDLRMPVMDGLETNKRIKAEDQDQATIVVALTASAFEEDRERILAEGFDDFIRKPFREGEIFDMLARHLGVRFVYEGEATQPTITQPGEVRAVQADQLTRDTFSELPCDWVASLREAATQLDGDVILALLEQIRGRNPPRTEAIADGVASMVRDFRFDMILALTEPKQE